MLRTAAAEGRARDVRELLASGADANEAYTTMRTTALHVAATADVRALAAAGADLDPVDGYGRTPLHRAVADARVDVVRALLAAGASTSAGREAVLCAAAGLGSVEVVEALLAAGAATKGAVRAAAEGGHADVVRLLLAVEELDPEDPALATAAARGHTDIVAMLLEAGARSPEALTIAVGSRRHDVVRLLLEAGVRDPWALGMAAEQSDVESARLLLACSPPPPLETPLCSAAAQGSAEMVELLVDAGASVRNSKVLLRAVESGHRPVVRQLLALGAPCSTALPDGQTVLHVAAQRGDKGMAEALLAAGAAVDALATGRTPLFDAAQGGHVAVVEALIGAGANVNARYLTFSGAFTPLKVAAMSRVITKHKKAAIDALLRAGAAFDASDPPLLRRRAAVLERVYWLLALHRGAVGLPEYLGRAVGEFL